MHDLTVAAIREHLTTERLGRSLDVRATAVSTNTLAKEAAEAGADDGHIVIADGQTGGRGTHDRTWSSPAGTDIYLSVVVRPRCDVRHLPQLTLAVGLAVAEACEALVGTPAQVKWPNDVLLDGKKAAGILVESWSRGDGENVVIVGIGLNVNRAHFDAPLDRTATSLHLVSGSRFDRAQVLAALLQKLEDRIDQLERTGPEVIVNGLRARLAFLGQPVAIDSHMGTLLGIDEDGRAVLETAAGRQAFHAGRLARVGGS